MFSQNSIEAEKLEAKPADHLADHICVCNVWNHWNIQHHSVSSPVAFGVNIAILEQKKFRLAVWEQWVIGLVPFINPQKVIKTTLNINYCFCFTIKSLTKIYRFILTIFLTTVSDHHFGFICFAYALKIELLLTFRNCTFSEIRHSRLFENCANPVCLGNNPGGALPLTVSRRKLLFPVRNPWLYRPPNGDPSAEQ